jgi:hypothetical protein
MISSAHHPLSAALKQACRRRHVRPTRFLIVVSIGQQALTLLEKLPAQSPSPGWRPGPRQTDVRSAIRISSNRPPPYSAADYERRGRYVISTSRFGAGQERNSNQTPLGLHRIAAKIGAGWPIGTVFQARKMVGYTWQGLASAAIAGRILWLEGLEPGFNRGGDVDTRRRYIYIHGLGDELTLGRPASRGCVHMAESDLLPLFDQVPVGTLVWIHL